MNGQRSLPSNCPRQTSGLPAMKLPIDINGGRRATLGSKMKKR